MSREWFDQSKKHFAICMWPWISLGFSLAVGVLIGLILAKLLGSQYFLLMRTAVCGRVSIVSLFAVNLLPFLISAFAVYFSKPQIVFCVCFIKSILMGAAVLAMLRIFGSAAWLVFLLFQFSSLCLFPVLCWFSIRHWAGNRDTLKKDFTICACTAVLILVFDYCLISPFLAGILEI